MKYAITADLNLTADNEDRLRYFGNLLAAVESQGIRDLIIAGDFFDQGYSGYKAVDAVLAQHPAITVTAIPGNHDPDILPGQFTAKNIRVIRQPEYVAGGTGETGLLFVPYREGSTLGEVLTETKIDAKKSGPWVLVSHGDYGTSARDINGNESGYFPLTRRDLAVHTPLRVILGHIHKPSALDQTVLTPGSPWPIDPSETGARRFLVLDTRDGSVTAATIGFVPCWLDWTVFVLPDGNEPERIKQGLAKHYLDWEQKLASGEQTGPINVRVSLRGCTARRSEADGIVKKWFADTPLVLVECTSDELRFVETDSSLRMLTAEFEKALDGLMLDHGQFPGDQKEMLDLIREYGLAHIYGAKG